MRLNYIFYFLVILLFVSSCSKDEGVGGKNTITGIIIKQDYTASTNQLFSSYPAQEERVYIVYGDKTYFEDETRTNYDGTFRFDYLYKGKYTVFVYSECLACPGETEALLYEIDFDTRKGEHALDTIYIKNYVY